MTYPPEWGHRFRLTIGYVVLAVAVIFALRSSHENQERIEAESKENRERIEAQATAQATANCEAVNDAKTALDKVLLALAAPRPTDEPGEYEDRLELYEAVVVYVEPNECPPPTPEKP